ncbi:MAG: O-acetylhomoserine aminocarboxypropyltransferase/cysteine synthase [Eubacteriales bacterium]|nr:O-acetylhomoserine aminocarboxypropyltransferase/cysteine synthase [Eubacteriales bacterium]
MKKETQCIHSGYKSKNGEPMALPIFQSTTFTYDSTDDIGRLFDLKGEGHMYSRISNPTVAYYEKKLAEMEGGIAAVCTVSGQSAVFVSLFNILSCGDHFVTGSKIYGGTTNLFAVTMKRMGIDCTFVDLDSDDETIQKAFRPNTKALFGETLANPSLEVLDIERIAKIAHKNGVPFIVDNTFPTPVLCNPIKYGADIIVHSTTKYLDGHALQVGGAVIDSGNFNWEGGKYPGLTEPDESYHGVVYTKTFGNAAYANKLRAQLIRDFGLCPPAISVFLTDMGTQTLGVRMKVHCNNAMRAAEFFEKSDKIEKVIYPGLKSSEYYALAMKYLPKGQSGVLSVIFKEGRKAGIKFMDSLSLARNVVHVADIRTLVLHPASETHRQLTDEQLKAAGISPGLVRISVGIEDIEDITADFEQALRAVQV